LNALLEKAGVVEPSSRIMILGALEPETEVKSSQRVAAVSPHNLLLILLWCTAGNFSVTQAIE
jgi:hypothetical protein